jgi:hypothetical protein
MALCGTEPDELSVELFGRGNTIRPGGGNVAHVGSNVTHLGSNDPRAMAHASCTRATLARAMTEARATATTALHAAAFVACVATLAFFFHAGLSANPGSRVLTVLAVVEHGSLRADEWRELTIDKAIVDGHFFSDKAPLSSFVVIPFYALWRLVERGPQTAADVDVAVLLGDVVASAIPLGAFALLLYRRAARGIAHPEAVFVALLATLGTSLLSYGGVYLGHALGGALFLYSYDEATRPKPRALLAGVLAGLAVLTELPLAIGVASVGVFLATRPDGKRLAARYVAGGLPFAALLGAYDASITGSPFDPPYHHLIALFYTQHPYVLDLHTLAVARDLLVSEYRGLFFYAPALLLLAPLAALRAESRARRRLLVGFVATYFVFIASFWMWDGGWCIGPRHLAPVMMVLLYEGVDALARSAPGMRAPFVGLASAGVAINLIAVATNPFVEVTRHPFNDMYWPAFARGDLNPDNLLRELGHPLGRSSLLVWGGLFLLFGWALGRSEAPRVGKPA